MSANCKPIYVSNLCLFSGPPSQLELRSSGGAGEHQGAQMGLYQLLPGGGEGPVYQQLHNTNDKQHVYIYRWDNSRTAQHNILQSFSMLQNKISRVSWHFQFATFTSLSSWRASKLNPGASENHRWDADWSGIIQYCPVADRIGRVPFTRWQDTPRHRI